MSAALRAIRVGLKGHPGIFPLCLMACAGFLIIVDKSVVRATIAFFTTLIVFGPLVVISAYQMGREQLRNKSDELRSPT